MMYDGQMRAQLWYSKKNMWHGFNESVVLRSRRLSSRVLNGRNTGGMERMQKSGEDGKASKRSGALPFLGDGDRLLLSFPAIDDGEPVHDEAIGDEIERVQGDCDPDLFPVGNLLIELPVEGDHGGVQAIPDNPDHTDKGGGAGKTWGIVSDCRGKHEHRQDHAHGQFEDEVGAPAGEQILPFLIVGHGDKLDDQIGDHRKRASFAEFQGDVVQ